ncbi:hypothetical protein Dform_00088 [Dehalogenimonas formicexedens]|uniref:DUF4064 domain-containing protein n=1 Tax=Dehalogenimonas formicexedens TaxID=1839801 RepID=A0A1P8F4Q1_9CHLR|nr:hypothetical protein [Dehalogenimonas formicexedens]APV43451.1 hypothetical protein Dform_00088 [Dehalogenimonas formicexedens]
MSISRLGYTLALIGGILMVVFGILAVAQSTFRAAFYGWGFFNGGIITLLAGIIAVIGASRVRELVWAIILIVIGLLGGGLGGLLVLIGGILGLVASVSRQN